ncbi:hypothetical protein [Kibdelosporangium phytohabitans]|uniref:Uncharacterized protein n=1 Tax=Kibdelosporangium phytohabitans TaxID=860235 RepID=A0A0N9HVL7_9PSEU|nr:hypothetical protein [Kibdelosporangium phytohabitans]ALG06203.1 hypothetical protein AOZ06_04020 [Kibdelosporangium phytohabitans]MBE1465698.1 hypothetical protein [Kibdelosporangium phytohabitans]
MLTFQEEQGVDDVGKCAHGLFLLQPTSTKGTTPVKPLRAPLVLQPLTVTPRAAAETDYVLELVGVPEVNPVLLYALNRQHGIDLDVEELTDELNAMIEENDDRSTHAGLVYAALSDVVAGHGRAAEFEERQFASTRHVEDTLVLFEKDVFGDKLEDYCFATGDRRWRSAHPRPLNWWQQRKARKQATELRKAGKCSRRTLHAELSATLVQRNRWQEMAAGGAHRRKSSVSPRLSRRSPRPATNWPLWRWERS